MVSADRTLVRDNAVPFVASLAEREKEMVETALWEAGGVVGGSSGAADKRQTLESKIREQVRPVS